MSEGYKIRNKDNVYFITLTIVGWIDIFTRPNNKQLIVNSLNHCIKNKGLEIYSWCLMSNHIHLICIATEQNTLSDILRDFKTYTSKKIIQQIVDEPESRQDWMLEYFSSACLYLKRKQNYKVWQDGNQPKEIFSTSFLYEKLEYIHNNPVKQMIVEKPWEYLHSSARDNADMDGLVNVFVLGHRPLIDNWKY